MACVVLGSLRPYVSCAAPRTDAPPHGHDERLHFSHPLIAESPSPDTKVRVDYFQADDVVPDAGTRRTVRLEAEYAFADWLSLETDIPFTSRAPADGESRSRIDNAELALKYANFANADDGLLLGGGVSFGLPTGDEEAGIGSGRILDVEPYADAGYERGPCQFVGFLSIGLPVALRSGESESAEFAWHFSTLVRPVPILDVLLEFDGAHELRSGEYAVYATPEVKLEPSGDEGLSFGAGLRLPIAGDREFRRSIVASVFYHF